MENRSPRGDRHLRIFPLQLVRPADILHRQSLLGDLSVLSVAYSRSGMA